MARQGNTGIEWDWGWAEEQVVKGDRARSGGHVGRSFVKSAVGGRGRMDVCAKCGVSLPNGFGVRVEGDLSTFTCLECTSENDRSE